MKLKPKALGFKYGSDKAPNESIPVGRFKMGGNSKSKKKSKGKVSKGKVSKDKVSKDKVSKDIMRDK